MAYPHHDRRDAHGNAVSEASGISVQVVAGIVESLFTAGFLELTPNSPPPPRPIADPQILASVAKTFAKAIGPLAEIIIDEEMEAMGEQRDQFPHDKLPELAERMSAGIRDEGKRLTFMQAVLDLIRHSPTGRPISIQERK